MVLGWVFKLSGYENLFIREILVLKGHSIFSLEEVCGVLGFDGVLLFPRKIHAAVAHFLCRFLIISMMISSKLSLPGFLFVFFL